MKIIIFSCLCVVASGFYTDVDEKLDLEKILADPNDMHKYIDCFLDKGPCTDTMKSYKKHFKEATENACADCSPTQKHIVEQFIKVAIAKYPQELIEIQKKYDPSGTHMAKVLAELAKF